MSTDDDDAPERRITPGARARIDALGAKYRRFARAMWAALAVLAVGMFLALAGFGYTLHRVQEGRRTSLSVTCAATNAVINAGRAIIAGDHGPGPAKFVRALERLGYPPRHEREAFARAAAAQYAQTIARGVAATAGSKARHVVLPDGSLDCHALRALGNTSH